jgi:tetratricopeptide (TPR) repeat protein
MMIGFAGGFLLCGLHRQWTQVFFVLTLMITPFVLLASIGYDRPINGRYLISLLPLYYVMAGRGSSGLSNWIVNISRFPKSYRATLLWGLLIIIMVVYTGLSVPQIGLTRWNVGQNWHGVSQFLAQTAQPEQLIVVDGKPTQGKALQYYLPGFNVVGRDPQLSYDSLFSKEEDFWVVFQFGTDIYSGLKRWVDNRNSVGFIFSGGWYPDIAQTTALRPAQSWDLYVVYISRSIDSSEEAIRLYETWLPQAETIHLRGHLTWAEAYRRFNRPGLAIPEYTSALNEEYVNDQLASYIYDARGRSWHKLGQIEQAIADWQQAIALAEWSDEPYQHLGSILIQSGRADAAQALYREGITTNPKKAWPHVLMGDYFLGAGLDGRAIKEYNKAIEIEPSDPIPYERLREMYAAAGAYTKIVSVYRDALRRNPLSAWPHFQLGQFYQSQGQVSKALAEYQEAVELNPEYTPGVSRSLSGARWDLGTVLNLINVYSDQEELLWWPGNSWVRPYPYDHEVIVGHSRLTVEGRIHPNQLLIHPFSDQENTYIEFEIPDNKFAYLQVGYGLADDVVGLSNGVEYKIEVRRQGSSEYDTLFAHSVTRNLWQEQAVSLASYWEDDLDFRIIVGAIGDYANDWLQTTFELTHSSQNIWSLSAHLTEIQFQTESEPLEWRGDGFYTANGNRLLGSSELTVAGYTMSDQIHLHPYSSEIDSAIIYTLKNHPYRVLKTSYGLADHAMPYSNGVEYAVSVSMDGGQLFQDLLRTTVETNTWSSALLSLPSSQDLVLKLSASARQDETYDWLQIRVFLLPFDNEQGFIQRIPANEAGQ